MGELLALFQASISTLQILPPLLELILVLPTCRTNTMRFVSGESQDTATFATFHSILSLVPHLMDWVWLRLMMLLLNRLKALAALVIILLSRKELLQPSQL